MNSSRLPVLITGASFAGFLLAQNPPPAGVVEGLVVNSATGAGIGGASVALSGNQSAHYDVTTDAAGHFQITGVAPGQYIATAGKDGLVGARPDFFLSANPGFRVLSGGDPVKVELKLAPLNTIFGRVFGPDGKPAVGAEVDIYPKTAADMEVTDAEGRFEFESIRPGSYLLLVRPPKNSKPEQAPDGSRTAIVPTYYPSVVDRSLAQEIVFRDQGGDFGGGYEIRMQTAAVHSVRGIVLDEEGKPSPRAELNLSPAAEDISGVMGLLARAGAPTFFAIGLRPQPRGVPEATVIAGEDGHFEFPSVRSGNWRIEVESDPKDHSQTHGGVSSRGKSAISVGRDDVEDLQIHIARPFNLGGTIEWKDGDPGIQRTSRPRFSFVPVFLTTPDSNLIRPGTVNSGRLFLGDLLPGSYKAIINPGLSARIFLGDYEVSGQEFAVTASSPPLRLVLQTRAGAVRGKVENGEGATVVLVPQRIEGMAIGQSIRGGPGGSFELNEVSPGDYYIAAIDHLANLFPSATDVNLVSSRGTNVKVEEGATGNVTLSVIAAPQ